MFLNDPIINGPMIILPLCHQSIWNSYSQRLICIPCNIILDQDASRKDQNDPVLASATTHFRNDDEYHCVLLCYSNLIVLRQVWLTRLGIIKATKKRWHSVWISKLTRLNPESVDYLTEKPTGPAIYHYIPVLHLRQMSLEITWLAITPRSCWRFWVVIDECMLIDISIVWNYIIIDLIN